MGRVRTTFLALLMAIAGQVAYGQTEETFSAVNHDALKSVKLYPNPATDFLVIRFEMPVAKTVKLQLHTIIGNELETDAEVVDEFEIHLKVKDLPVGYYLLALQDDSHQRNSFKFLKR